MEIATSEFADPAQKTWKFEKNSTIRRFPKRIIMNHYVGKFVFHPVGHGLFYTGEITDDQGKTFSFAFDSVLSFLLLWLSLIFFILLSVVLLSIISLLFGCVSFKITETTPL